MEITVITSSKKNDNEAEIITKLFEAGLSTLHLRKPQYSTKQLTHLIEQIPAHFHNRIVVHSHHDLVFKFNLKGVHFTNVHLERKFKKWWFLRKLRVGGKKIFSSRSYHKLSEVYNTEEIKFNSYLLGTVFNSLTNTLYSGFYEHGITAAIKTSGKEFVARGGINPNTIEMAWHLGFKGVALHSYIWKSDDPFSKFVEVLDYCKTKGIPVDY